MEQASAPGTGDASEHLRYAVDEDTPTLLTLGLSAQVVTVVLTGIILIPIIVLTAADRKEFIEWAVFATLLVSGLVTMLQARPIGPFGAGYPLYMGTSGAFIAVCTAAATIGGLPLLATLVASSALVQFLFAARLSLFRRLITPTVGGTVILLLAVTVFPIATDMLVRVPAGSDPGSAAGPTVAFATFVVIVLISLFSRGAVQLWAPLIGILSRYRDRRGRVRDARLDPPARRALVRSAQRRLARPRPRVRRALLRAPDPVRHRHDHRRHRDLRRRHRHPARDQPRRRCPWTSARCSAP